MLQEKALLQALLLLVSASASAQDAMQDSTEEDQSGFQVDFH